MDKPWYREAMTWLVVGVVASIIGIVVVVLWNTWNDATDRRDTKIDRISSQLDTIEKNAANADAEIHQRIDTIDARDVEQQKKIDETAMRRSSATRADRSSPAPTATSPPSGEYASARVSWYHLPGNNYANGQPYDSSLAFAHCGKWDGKKCVGAMPFGTRVEFCYQGRCAVGVCKDRGPFISGRMFDLNKALANAIGMTGVQTVQWKAA